MKTLKCDLCDYEAEGETFPEWMENLKPHYMEAHADFIKKRAEASTPEEQQARMQKWMADNQARFDAA